jgi:hypothetical protein
MEIYTMILAYLRLVSRENGKSPWAVDKRIGMEFLKEASSEREDSQQRRVVSKSL